MNGLDPRSPGRLLRRQGRESEAWGWLARPGLAGWAVGLVLAVLAGLAAGNGCGSDESPLPENALVVTQSPAGQAPGRSHESGEDWLDARYRAGSRVVLVPHPETPDRVVVLSAGLHAAGAPAVGPDGGQVLFAGKAGPTNAWQIYRTTVRGGNPVAVTALSGGAMDPVWLPAGRFVFSSPVPRLTDDGAGEIPALYSLAITGGPPVRLTWGLVPAVDPTVLNDGRILFVSGVPASDGARPAALSLFTVNNDGTEIAAFAGQHDGPANLRRPRAVTDGRVVFLAGGSGSLEAEGRIEQVLMARPFHSRSVAFPQIMARCRSVEPLPDGALLASLRESGPERGSGTFAVYRLAAGAASAGSPLLDDPAWDDVEAVSASRPGRPMGRLSTVEAERRDGVLLCLDANLTDHRGGTAPAAAVATGALVRVIRHPGGTAPETLGEIPLGADGSFLAKVPADSVLSLEVLDAQKRPVRRCPPTVWVRPGENRSCVGCHEPHNRAPENLRPLAVRQPPADLTGRPAAARAALTQNTGSAR